MEYYNINYTGRDGQLHVFKIIPEAPTAQAFSKKLPPSSPPPPLCAQDGTPTRPFPPPSLPHPPSKRRFELLTEVDRPDPPTWGPRTGKKPCISTSPSASHPRILHDTPGWAQEMLDQYDKAETKTLFAESKVLTKERARLAKNSRRAEQKAKLAKESPAKQAEVKEAARVKRAEAKQAKLAAMTPEQIEAARLAINKYNRDRKAKQKAEKAKAE